MKYRFVFLLLIILLGSGCTKKPTIDMKTIPKLQQPKKLQPIAKRKKGALYSRQGASLFADKKDLQIGDILQVIVQETLKNDSKGSRAVSKAGTTSLGGGLLTSMTGVTPSNRAKKIMDNANNNLGIGFTSATTNTFAGAPTSKVDEKFSTTISVIIEQIYQNGNYFVKGSKEFLIDDQKQYMAISGVIRPYDITPENTIYSQQLANLKIKYSKDGEENDVNHKSWGTKFLETIWPF